MNKGEYLGVNNFNMRPSDKFALMFVPHGKVEYLTEYPNQTGAKSPLFSLTTVDTEDSFPTLKLADVGADGQTFAIDESSRSDADFYALLSIDGYEWQTPTKGGSNDFSPPDDEWKLTRYTTNPNVSIVIKLYDSDRGVFNNDDHIDIDWRSGDDDLHLNYNWITGQITGDLNGFRGQQIYASGGGDNNIGEIWFTIDSFT